MPKTELAVTTYYRARNSGYGRWIGILSALLSVMMTVSEAKRGEYNC